MFIPELTQIERLLTSFLGEPKTSVSDTGQLQYNCPKCVDEKGMKEIGKYNLEINLFKGVFMCWSCCSYDDDMKGSIKKLIKKYGDSSILREYDKIISDIRNNALYKLPEYEGLVPKEEIYLTLPSTFTKITDITKVKKQVKEYLEKRNIDQRIINRFNIGYTTWDEPESKDRNRIIIPSYDDGDNLNFWVGRDFTGNEKRSKYSNCKGVKKTEIVFQESKINYDADITLVEGALDCVYGPNTISLLGKTLSDEDQLYLRLKERANANITICLDADTKIEETKKIYKILNKGRLRGKIWYIRMEKYKDFGEAFEDGGRTNIIELLKTRKQFEETDLSW